MCSSIVRPSSSRARNTSLAQSDPRPTAGREIACSSPMSAWCRSARRRAVSASVGVRSGSVGSAGSVIRRSRYGPGSRPRKPTPLQDRQVALELVRRDVGLVRVPFLTLVPDQELVDVVAERVRAGPSSPSASSIASCRSAGQRADPRGAALVLRHLVDVVRRLGRQLAAPARSRPGRPRASTANARYGLQAGSGERYSIRVASSLPGLYCGTRTSAERLRRAQQT